MNLLYLTFLFPLVGFLLLAFSRGRFSENLAALIGVGSIGLSFAVAAYVDLAVQRRTACRRSLTRRCCGPGWRVGRLSRRTSRCAWMACR